MTTYSVHCCLYASAEGKVEFEDGKTWNDVESWYVKWDTLHIKFKDAETYEEFALDSAGMDVVDWKRPQSVSIYEVDADGNVDYNKEVDGDD